MNRESAPRFSGIGGHHSHRSGTVEWLTPPSIIAALGPFDLDPCAPTRQPYPTAARTFTVADNGLLQRWSGRVWLNPPYANGIIDKWLARMADHGNGTALIFARTDTEAFHRHVFDRAFALLFMAGRINFHVGRAFVDEQTGRRYEVGDRAPGNAGAPTVLCAYGLRDADVLATCGIDGKFVALRLPKVVLFESFDRGKGCRTWADVVRAFAESRDGPFALDELYRHVRSHPKARASRHPEAKARQQLQRGGYRRLQRGLWEIEK